MNDDLPPPARFKRKSKEWGGSQGLRIERERWGQLAKLAPQELREVILEELLGPALASLRDGLLFRSQSGAPNGRHTRLFFEVVGLVGVKGEVAEQIVRMLGMQLDEAQRAAQLYRSVGDMTEEEAAKVALDRLREYYRAQGKTVVVLDDATAS